MSASDSNLPTVPTIDGGSATFAPSENPAGRSRKKASPRGIPARAPSDASTGAAPIAAIEQPAVEQAVAAQDITMDTITDATDKAQAFTHEAQANTRDMMAKSQQMFEEWNSFAKGNVEAMVESSKIAARGFESIGQDAAAFAKRSFEGASGAVKTLATVKSPTEFMKFQSDYARTAFDQMVAETSRGTEAMIKLAGEIAQPLSNRVAVAMEKAKVVA